MQNRFYKSIKDVLWGGNIFLGMVAVPTHFARVRLLEDA